MMKIADIPGSWPFKEAQELKKCLDKAGKKIADAKPVIFETGYGASGLPHIGTFGEVARTSMVRRAFEHITSAKTRLICFSDDMDGLRKIPENLPQQNMLAEHLEKPLSDIPDPFGTHESFAAHNNARLCAFLDEFGFDYNFKSATQCYRSGQFDAILIAVLEHYDKITQIVRPTLGQARQKTYSPFLPICPRTGRVLLAEVVAHDVKAQTIAYLDPQTQEKITVKITGGACKLQWKVDWAMRWIMLGVDYEMAGKDLIDSVKLSGKICRALGGSPPQGFSYEMFLDAKGEKISKSRGNGLSMEEWLRYAPSESLSLFMFRQPKTAKRMHFDVIPRQVDDYLNHITAWKNENEAEQLKNPIWFMGGKLPKDKNAPVTFSQLLNLVSASSSRDPEMLWSFVHAIAPDATAATHPFLDNLIHYAIRYSEDFVLPNKHYRPASKKERDALEELAASFNDLNETADGRAIHEVIYAVGQKHKFDNRDWFQALYEILLGQSSGARFGSFVALYGLDRTKDLIDKALKKSD